MTPGTERLHRALAEIKLVVKNIDHQIDEVQLHYPDPYRLMDRNGRFVMVDILAAKANCLVAISHLEREIAAVSTPPGYIIERGTS